MNAPLPQALGRLTANAETPSFTAEGIASACQRVREPCSLVLGDGEHQGRIGVVFGGGISSDGQGLPVIGGLPAVYPEWLGDRSFCEVHGTRFPYVVGAMANGIASTEIVIAAARGDMLGFFGSAGLVPERVLKAINELQTALLPEGRAFGMNLIHSPHEPEIEQGVVELYLKHGITRVSASAYMDLTPMVVQYACSGLTRGADGSIERKNYLFAKISGPEVAERFLRPAPQAILDKLVAAGKLTAEEAALARHVPVAEDITVEADSGGHTDNQILTAVFPTVLNLKKQICAEQGYQRPVRVGAAGGLGTPDAVAAAFSLGAAYVLTGSVNQAAMESGLSFTGKKMLAQATLRDVMMAPAADMFEMGVKVQVLRRGTMFGVRAQKLYELYTTFDSLDAIPDAERQVLEKQILKDSIENVWASTYDFFQKRDPSQNERAETDPKHKMALVFRWYLGQSSRWAINDTEGRALDFQVWCGPAMGSFNQWTKGSFLEQPENRTVVQIGRNLLEGAARITRAAQLRSAGVEVPDAAFAFTPRPLA
jgi:trans-AT polyketide synthase/acyltransferase/oxidoreductase domain-containing protein